MKVRKFHRYLAIALSPLLLILSATGCLLFFRKAGIYTKETKKIIESIHTWELIMPYIGLVMGVGLFVLTITGIILFFNKRA